MPPGSDLEKIGAPNLRNPSNNSRLGRHSLPRTALVAANTPTIAKATNMSQKRRKTEPKKPIITQKEEEENQDLVERISKVATTDNEPNPEEKTIVRNKKSRRSFHPAAEIFSKKLYRQLASGYDLDADSDQDVPGTSQQATISDGWKPEYSGGNQELANPDNIPRMQVMEDDLLLEEKIGFVLPAKLIACNLNATYYNAYSHVPGDSRDSIHYEITAQDVVFIEKLNAQRKLLSGDTYLTTSKFVEIVKSLEVEAFKKIHDQLLDSLHVVYTRPPEDGTDDEAAVECDVCRIADCDVSDEMVFCDMCNTCVHMVCAGIETLPLPSEPWKCVKCELAGTPSPKCILCPALGGSMTYNKDRTQWAHHVCALFMPEILFENEEMRAPLTHVERVAAERWHQTCAVCDTKLGACITCSFEGCEETHHICCALRVGLTVRIQEVPNDPEHNVTRVTYCHRHTPQQELPIQEKFRGFRNPWLAKLESVFYLMTDYEKVAELLNIEEIIVSDVYEYWKQKRLAQSGAALIPHLQDHIQLVPEIQRVAEKASINLAASLASHRPPSSPTSAPTSASRRFFPRAALMVTELRQHHLKRVRERLADDRRMLTMLERREELKREALLADMKMLEVAKRCPRAYFESLKVTKAQLQKAQSAETLQTLLRELESMKEVTKSPLRPRNGEAKRRGRTRVFPIGYVRPTPYGKRGRPTNQQREARLQMSTVLETPPPSPLQRP